MANLIYIMNCTTIVFEVYVQLLTYKAGPKFIFGKGITFNLTLYIMLNREELVSIFYIFVMTRNIRRSISTLSLR